MFSYLCCAAFELRRSQTPRKGSLRDFALLACFSYGGTALTNHALGYLDYATRIVFKSVKLLPVMGFSVLIVGRRYDIVEWFCAILLGFGVFQFMLGDATYRAEFALKGVVLMITAVSMDSICANIEEQRFFRSEEPCSTQEVTCFTSLFGTMYSFLHLRVSGELTAAIRYCKAHPHIIPSMVCFSISGYLSVTCTLAIIKYFGAPEAEFVKSLRKVLSILLSFAVYRKEINRHYQLGMCAVIGSIMYLLRHKNRKRAMIVEM